MSQDIKDGLYLIGNNKRVPELALREAPYWYPYRLGGPGVLPEEIQVQLIALPEAETMGDA